MNVFFFLFRAILNIGRKINPVKGFFQSYLIKQNEIKMENINFEVMYL